MSDAKAEDLTLLLQSWRSGDLAALDRATPLLYNEMRRVASSYLRRERADHTLTPTGLINEVYLRLLGQDQPDWQSRKHFLGVAARLMRQVLVDCARRKRAGKRGGGVEDLPLDEELHGGHLPVNFLDLDSALSRLEMADARKSTAIELRYFGGLTVAEIGAMLDVSAATISRELHLAEAWLGRELAIVKQSRMPQPAQGNRAFSAYM